MIGPRRRRTSLRNLIWAVIPFVSLIAEAATAQVVTVTKVNGTIFDVDGTRLLYAPSDQANHIDILNLSSQANTSISIGSGYTAKYGFLTPTGTAFVAEAGSVLTAKIFNYNGNLTVAGNLNSDLSLHVSGAYAEFSGYLSGNLNANLYRLDTSNGALIQVPGPSYDNWNNDITSTGVVVASTNQTAYQIVSYDGSTLSSITNTGTSTYNFYVRSDGQTYVFDREQPCCTSSYSDLVLVQGGVEQVLRVGLGVQRALPGTDYQVANGWVLFRQVDGTIVERSPSGVFTSFGPSKALVDLSPDGDFTYITGDTLYLETLAGQSMAIGSASIYSNAVKIGPQWYFFGSGLLSELSPKLVTIDSLFNASSDPFTTADGAILEGLGNVTTSRPIILTGQTTLNAQNYQVELDAMVSGAGALAIQGQDGGTAILTADNTYSGGTTILTDSRLQLGEGGTTGSIIGNVHDDGMLLFDHSNTYTFAGTIDGVGAVDQIGGGTTILTGSNTYSGGTTISAGTMQLGNGGNAGSVDGAIIDNASLVFDRSDTVKDTHTISGVGSVTQAGPGQIILDGNYSYTGLTTVAAGTLQIGDDAHDTLLPGSVAVAAGGRLEGQGVIAGSLDNTYGGVVMPGGATRSLTAGAYSQSANSTFEAAISAANVSSLHVTGTAALDGTLKVDFAPSTNGAHSYRIISARAIAGRFSAFQGAEGLSGEMYGVAYSPGAVDVVIEPVGSGQIYSDLVTSKLETAETIGGLVFDHADASKCQVTSIECRGMSIWAQGIGGVSSQAGTGNARGFNTRSDGVIGGLDINVSQNFAASLSVFYNRGSLNVGNAGGRATSNTAGLWLNAHTALPEGQLDFSGFWIMDSSRVQRAVMIDGQGPGSAQSQPGTKTYGTAMQYSAAIFSKDVLAIGRLGYTRVALPETQEGGAGPFNLAISGQTYMSTYGQIGLRWDHAVTTRSGTYIFPDVLIGARYQFGPLSTPITEHLQNAVGPEFQTMAAARRRLAGVLGLGVSMRQRNNLSLYLRVDERVSRGENQGMASIGAHVRF